MSEKLVFLDRMDANGPNLDRSDVENHPMRLVTKQVAFEESSWSSQRLSTVMGLFDSMAEEWSDKDFSERGLPVFDALKRGGISHGKIGLELGSGTGAYSSLLSRYFDSLMCIDLSFEMLKRSESTKGLRVQGDGAQLPITDSSIDGLICINTLLFPQEIDRIISDNGYLLWVSTSGPQTPIYLSPAECLSALGDGFSGVSSSCGLGTWTVFRRA